MKQQYTATPNQKIPDAVLKTAVEHLKAGGFKHMVDAQARRMIEETTEIVNTLGGRIVWGDMP